MLNRDLFKAGETVAVAFSGGKDSACLFDLLLSLKDSLSITLKAINIDHGIRGESSVKDSEFVKAICVANGIELKFYKLDCKKFSLQNGYSEEEGARIARYDCFRDAIESGFCDKVATAHHLADSVETVLFNLFRGASYSGVTGISGESMGGKIIRPLSSATRTEIDEYIATHGVKYVTDETNLKDEYSRNYIRNKVLPVIKERFPEAEKSIGRFAEIAERENAYLNSLAEFALKTSDGAYLVSCALSDCLFARAVVIALKRLGVGKDYVKAHVDAVIGLKTAENGSRADLPKKIRAAKEYGDVAIYDSAKSKPDCIEIPYTQGKIGGFDKKLSFENKREKTDGVKYLRFDADKIPAGTVIRYRKSGDEFKKFGGGTKKLNDYFTDVKIPLRLRDRIPLVCSGKNVLIICGIEISDLVKVDKTTKNMLQCIYVD